MKLGPASSQRRLVKEESVVRAEPSRSPWWGWGQEGKRSAESVGPGEGTVTQAMFPSENLPDTNHRKQIGV